MNHARRASETDDICAIVRRHSPETVDKVARDLFAAEPDDPDGYPGLYPTFDDMPHLLQEWWRDRAASQIVSAPYENPNVAPHEPA